jgi:hypothetical protein
MPCLPVITGESLACFESPRAVQERPLPMRVQRHARFLESPAASETRERYTMKARPSVLALVWLVGLADCGTRSDTNDAGPGPSTEEGSGTSDGTFGSSSGNGSDTSSGGPSGSSSGGSGASSGGATGASASGGSGTAGTGVADASCDQGEDASGDGAGPDVGAASAKDAGTCPSSQPTRGSLCFSDLGMTCTYGSGAAVSSCTCSAGDLIVLWNCQ